MLLFIAPMWWGAWGACLFQQAVVKTQMKLIFARTGAYAAVPKTPSYPKTVYMQTCANGTCAPTTQPHFRGSVGRGGVGGLRHGT